MSLLIDYAALDLPIFGQGVEPRHGFTSLSFTVYVKVPCARARAEKT